MMFFSDGYSIVACVFIQHLDNGKLTNETIDGKLSVNINLLGVHPTMVNRGITRYMMQAVEVIAKSFRYTHVFLSVLSAHKHLLDMYSEWGFNIIGTKSMDDSGFKLEKYIVPCHLIVMEKSLS
jgi:GNAT superfamily N-acetyltransferase